MLVVGERPPQLAPIRAVGQPARLAEAARRSARARRSAARPNGPVDGPDRVLGDHLEERARVAAVERGEDALDPRSRRVAQRSSGASVSP